ncbi:hypothetical protein D9757_004226 [Collybiopsis confluens]|uniref:Uncharacterized protein n=1 Tax=Collybiopsis confluens TaxID=2823264 RepID=A0A8H5HTY2_9AGAR|nr:hypothetical protein D9757_004226 [Collybiopsis confluens]
MVSLITSSIILFLFLISGNRASPIAPGKLIGGYRSVLASFLGSPSPSSAENTDTSGKQVKSDEYTKAGRLTDAKASGLQLGDGSYLVSEPHHWQEDDSICIVWFDKKLVLGAPKVDFPPAFPSPIDGRELPQYYLKDATAFYKPEKIKEVLRKAGKDPVKTIIFAKLVPLKYAQMLIPPYYLAPSSLPKRPGGPGNLGMSIQCEEDEDDLPTTQSAQWENYGIDGWPKDSQGKPVESSQQSALF